MIWMEHKRASLGEGSRKRLKEQPKVPDSNTSGSWPMWPAGPRARESGLKGLTTEITDCYAELQVWAKGDLT